MMRFPRTLQQGASLCQKHGCFGRPQSLELLLSRCGENGALFLHPSSGPTATRSFSSGSDGDSGDDWWAGRDSFVAQQRPRRESASSRTPRRGRDDDWRDGAPSGPRRTHQRWANLDESVRAAPLVGRGVEGVAAEGRVVSLEDDARRGPRAEHRGSASHMCAGCGTVVRAGGGGAGGMVTGRDAVGASDHRHLAQRARFVDTTDARLGGYLCQRCAALRAGDVWGAHDALRDVAPRVFKEQLKHLVSRRKFGFCLLVVDATDPEHTAVRNLRQCVDSTPVLLVLNKIDLLPRLTAGDQSALQKKIQKTGLRFLDSFAVSATTGEGLDALARKLSADIKGADVFVVGAANVGKSSVVRKLAALLSQNEYLEGDEASAGRRRESVEKLRVTASHLPGTTLQALRIPCFPSDQHALWDTPGIINPRALQYSIFPSHLMEPLTRPGAIAVPTPEDDTDIAMKPGETLLIEADWMHHTDDAAEEPCVLGRLDIVAAAKAVRVQAYLHPALRLRVVPTAAAPSRATIPAAHVQEVNDRIRRATRHRRTGLREAYSRPLVPYLAPDRPTGELAPGPQEYHAKAGRYYMDVSFASLGFLSLSDTKAFSTIPHCVQDSVFSKRRALYPTNLKDWLEEQEWRENRE